MIDSRVRFVTYRFSHHSPHSGYDRLASYGQHAIRARPLSRRLVRNRIMWWVANGVIPYDREALATEIKTAGHMLRHSGRIYHILYGENTYHYLGWLNNRRRNRLVATFHLPPARLREAIRIDWHLRQLSAIVCVGGSQVDFFADLVGQERVFFVPHGVDADYFSPPPAAAGRDENLCLFVGNHLRDFATLRGVIELVAFQRPQTRFVVVTGAGNQERIGLHPNVALRTHVPESELRALYRRAALMLLPLQDTTGNNSLLEAIACGLPVVASDVGSIRDYLSPDCAILAPPHNSRTMAEAALALLAEPQRRQTLAEAGRRRALELSWPKVAQQLQRVYEAVA